LLASAAAALAAAAESSEVDVDGSGVGSATTDWLVEASCPPPAEVPLEQAISALDANRTAATPATARMANGEFILGMSLQGPPGRAGSRHLLATQWKGEDHQPQIGPPEHCNWQ
jgi:hypothetical protein